MQQEIDSAEFAEWIAYDQLHPIGSEPIEHVIAELCALTFNIHKHQEVEPASPDDFKARAWREPEHEPEAEDLDEKVHRMFAGLMKG